MKVVETVEKDNAACASYKETAEKLKEKYIITPVGQPAPDPFRDEYAIGLIADSAERHLQESAQPALNSFSVAVVQWDGLRPEFSIGNQSFYIWGDFRDRDHAEGMAKNLQTALSRIAASATPVPGSVPFDIALLEAIQQQVADSDLDPMEKLTKAAWYESVIDLLKELNEEASIALASEGGQLTGAQHIAQERYEQIHKHGWDASNDADYGNGELLRAAAFCLDSQYFTWPNGWSEHFRDKILAKDRVQQLRVAGAFIAAEIDRLQALEGRSQPVPSPLPDAEGRYKVYELDFGDTNLLSEHEQVILDWIRPEMQDMKDGAELTYTITVRRMTREEIDALPEWQ
ncbi:hypothetical protein GCM10023184_18260 [Flaviaesturariibacter amylovorans]|uniref:Uncharacterized protein n=2 Tax=Flaviaesturariibacter amylovorans TaxID=1084520 RepID=A0ABP8GQ93_9BACT